MAESKTWYRPGLVFKATKCIGHQEICRSKHDIRAVDGTTIDTIPELLAEFAVFGAEYGYTNPYGEQDVAADIRGGFFDLDAQAESKGWDDDEKEVVARHMVRMCDRRNENFTLYSKPPAPRPWPTYDAVKPAEVATLAVTLGLVGEALAYEQDTLKRAEVLKALGASLAKAQADAVAEESLTAA